MIAFLLFSMAASGQQRDDRTAIALERCLAAPASRIRTSRPSVEQAPPEPAPDQTAADQTAQADSPAGNDAVPPPPDGAATCYDNARRTYDSRIVRAYRALMKRADYSAAQKLGAANQAWMNYRDAATSDADVEAAARDQALWLEGLLQGG